VGRGSDHIPRSSVWDYLKNKIRWGFEERTVNRGLSRRASGGVLQGKGVPRRVTEQGFGLGSEVTHTERGYLTLGATCTKDACLENSVGRTKDKKTLILGMRLKRLTKRNNHRAGRLLLLVRRTKQGRICHTFINADAKCAKKTEEKKEGVEGKSDLLGKGRPRGSRSST